MFPTLLADQCADGFAQRSELRIDPAVDVALPLTRAEPFEIGSGRLTLPARRLGLRALPASNLTKRVARLDLEVAQPLKGRSGYLGNCSPLFVGHGDHQLVVSHATA